MYRLYTMICSWAVSLSFLSEFFLAIFGICGGSAVCCIPPIVFSSSSIVGVGTSLLLIGTLNIILNSYFPQHEFLLIKKDIKVLPTCTFSTLSGRTLIGLLIYNKVPNLDPISDK